MKSLIFTAAISFQLFFFVLLSIIGYNYMGSEESPLYMYSFICINLIVICLFLKDLIFRKIIISKELIFIICGQIFLLLSFLIENPTNEFARKQPFAVFSLAMPICYVAYDVAKSNSWRDMTKWLDVLALLITIGVAINIPTIIISRGYADIPEKQEALNINYQSAAYYSAFAYAITLTLIMFGDIVYKRFNFFKSNIYNIISIALLVVQIALCLMSGGRGGAVLLFVATFVTFLFAERRKFSRLFTQILLVGVCIFIPSMFIFPEVGDEVLDVISKSSERTFSYISSSGIDMGETSNRDLEYGAALTCIAKSPIIGHGFFRYIDVKNYSIYPHNFVLELLLQGGVVLLTIVLIFLFYLYIKFRKMLKYDKTNTLLLPLICYPATMLLFSGSYMTTSLFWFVSMYIYCYNIKNPIIESK